MGKIDSDVLDGLLLLVVVVNTVVQAYLWLT